MRTLESKDVDNVSGGNPGIIIGGVLIVCFLGGIAAGWMAAHEAAD